MIEEKDGKFCIISHTSGKNLGCYDTKEEAEARLEEIKKFAIETLAAEETKEEPVNFVKPVGETITFAKKPIKMPILPAEPQKTVDGREVSQELIDGILAYDPAKRKAIVSLNKDAAHGDSNLPVLGRVEKVYKKDGLIYADVLPVQAYEDILPILASEQYPDRSLEADWLNLDGSDSKQLYLEAIKLCGSERPALNLPPVTFTSTTSTGKEIFNFTIGGGSTMAEEKKEEKAPETKQEESGDFTGVVQIDKELIKVKSEYSKRLSDVEEYAKKLAAQLLDKDLDHWVKSPKMLRKIPPYQRTNAVNIIKSAISGEQTTSFHFAKGIETIPLGDAIKSLLESLPDTLISTGRLGEGIPNQFDDVPISDQEKGTIALSKMRQWCKDNGKNMANPEDFTKAESAVKKSDPELFELQGVN